MAIVKTNEIDKAIKLAQLFANIMSSTGIIALIVITWYWRAYPSKSELEAKESIEKMYAQMADPRSDFNRSFTMEVASKMQDSIQKVLEIKNKDLLKRNNPFKPLEGPLSNNNDPLKEIKEKVLPVINVIKDKVDKLESDIGKSVATLSDAASFLALGANKPQLSGRVTLPILCLTKSLNLSKSEKLNLITKLMSVAPRYEEKSKAKMLSNKILITADFNPTKLLFVSPADLNQVERWLAYTDVEESRPAMDALPDIVSAALDSFSPLVERLVVVANHEFRFRNTQFTNWDRFKSVAFVIMEGPIPEYFEWGHINKMRDFRKKGQGNETKVRIFKRQQDKGLSQEEIFDLSTFVRELIYQE